VRVPSKTCAGQPRARVDNDVGGWMGGSKVAGGATNGLRSYNNEIKDTRNQIALMG
jgi:hypothetical protein